MNITAHRPTVIVPGHASSTDVDAIIPRIGASHTFYGTAVVRQFEMMGVFTANESQAISRGRDKLRSLQLLARNGHRPAGHRLRPLHQGHRRPARDRRAAPPLVVKLLEGTQGVGVVLAETKKAAESVIAAFRQLDANILVQEYIKEAGGTDIRCLRRRQPGGRRHASARARPASSAPTCTAAARAEQDQAHARGAQPSPCGPPAPWGSTSPASTSSGRNHGPVVMEVNSSPGLEGIEAATGVDVAGADHRVHREEPRRPPPEAAAQGVRPAMASTATRTTRNRAVNIAGTTVAPGGGSSSSSRSSRLPTATSLSTCRSWCVNGLRPGPRLWLSAVVHGDELNGIEIIRQVLDAGPPPPTRGHAAGRPRSSTCSGS